MHSQCVKYLKCIIWDNVFFFEFFLCTYCRANLTLIMQFFYDVNCANCRKKNKPTCTHERTVYFNNLLFSISVQLDTQDGVLLVDYSKNIITEETMKHLMNLVCINNIWSLTQGKVCLRANWPIRPQLILVSVA